MKNEVKPPKFYTIYDLRRHADHYSSPWFSKGSMKYFNTRLTSHFKQLTDHTYAFITTEKSPFTGMRRASIRVATLSLQSEGLHWKVNIETLGDFHSMSLYKAITKFNKEL